jgi:hypothetical protein
MSGSLEAFKGFDTANAGQLEAATAALDHTADFSGSESRFCLAEDAQGQVTLPGLTNGMSRGAITEAIFRAVQAEERGEF